MSKYLAIDLGASSGRIIFGNLNNKILTISEDYRFSNAGIETLHGFHWDYLSIYSNILIGLSTSVTIHGSQFEGIAVDTWGVDYVLLDRNGCPLAWPYHYRDDRTKDLLQEIFKIIPTDEIFSKTGIQFMELNSITQLYAHLLQNSELLSLADCFLMVSDYINYLLTGIKANEYTEACTSQLMNAKTADWDLDLITRLGLPKKIFNKIVPPGNILGKIHPLIIQKTGLSSTIPIINVASHDTNSAVAAIPCDMDKYNVGEWAFLSSGTWNIMGVEVNSAFITPEVFKYNFSNEGGVFNTINLLKNSTGLWIIQECKKIWEKENPSLTWDEITQFSQADPFTDRTFNMDNSDFTHPPNMIEAIQNHIFEKYNHKPSGIGEISRIIYESMVMKYQEILTQIVSITNKQIKALYIIGGGSQNDFLNQLIANHLNIHVIAGPIEATAIGNLLMQGVSQNEIESLSELRQIVRNSFEVKEFLPKS